MAIARWGNVIGKGEKGRKVAWAVGWKSILCAAVTRAGTVDAQQVVALGIMRSTTESAVMGCTWTHHLVKSVL